MELISIIISTFNRKSSLLTTIDTIFKQTYKNFELIIIDDGSTDDTHTALLPYIKKNAIRYEYQTNKGLMVARNKGIALAKGNYISILDSDINCSNDWLSSVYNTFNENPQIDILGTWPIHGKYYSYHDQMKQLGPPGGVRLADVSAIGGGILTARRDVFSKIGLIDEFGKFGYEDAEFCWRATLCGLRVVYLYDPLTFHMKDMSKGSRLPSKTMQFESVKNKLYVYWKLMRIRIALLITFKELLKSIYLIMKSPQHLSTFVNICEWFLKNRKMIVANRKEIQKHFSKSHRYLEKLTKQEKLIDLRNAIYYRGLDTLIMNKKR
jgi:glycosyltransferase involved in cell wall biosynthesis